MGTKDAIKIIKKRLERKPKLKKAYLEEKRNHFIACKIREYRKQANLTQKQLAHLINTTQSVISRLEHAEYRGHSLTILKKISKALDVPAKAFLEEAEITENSRILTWHIPPVLEEAASFIDWNPSQTIQRDDIANVR